mmetsp:Transcript_31516/g.57260  ORF Transcript_31516/g.57260 Transcript_31516/m.57260 type:complete len:374 (+) Transcript_31516:92-1213(+)
MALSTLKRRLLELPPSALDPAVELLNLPDIFALRRTCNTALRHCVLSAEDGEKLLPRVRCCVTESGKQSSCREGESRWQTTGPGARLPADAELPRCCQESMREKEKEFERFLETLQKLHLPSLIVLVHDGHVKELSAVASFVSSKARFLSNLEKLHLVAPARHHIGDTTVRQLAAAVRSSMPSLKWLALPGINVTRLASAALGAAAVAAPSLRRLDLPGSQITPSGWMHLLQEAATRTAERPCVRVVLGVSPEDPVHGLHEMAQKTGCWEVQVISQLIPEELPYRQVPGCKVRTWKWKDLDDFEEAVCCLEVPTPFMSSKRPGSEPPPLLRHALATRLRHSARPLQSLPRPQPAHSGDRRLASRPMVRSFSAP